MSNSSSNLMAIFGGTGDLTHRKLIPALYNLSRQQLLPENFGVISIGRRDKTDESYRNELRNSVQRYSRLSFNDEDWKRLGSRIFYFKSDFSDTDGYKRLKELFSTLDNKFNTGGNRVFYLATAPEYFDIIVSKLKENGMTEGEEPWSRVVIEKPFGKDLKSAKWLNNVITDGFPEKNIYRIDHYLGKEMLQSLMVIRFANAFFEPVWNNRFIDSVQISSLETDGIGSRGGYYESSGALRDMMQNHMMQLLTLTAMEPPYNLDSESIRSEKVKVLRSMEEFTHDFVERNMVLGQYGPGTINGTEVLGYRQEDKVSPYSNTETFIALKTHVNNFRWAGVPFYLRTGKRMPVKTTEIVIQFKDLPRILYFKEYGDLSPNLLIIKIQPKEGVFLRFNIKKPGAQEIILPVQMDFCHNCEEGGNTPEAYERLLSDIMKGDPTLFTSWEEVEYSWKLVDRLAVAWHNKDISFPNYHAGTWGPPGAEEMMAGDKRRWYI